MAIINFLARTRPIRRSGCVEGAGFVIPTDPRFFERQAFLLANRMLRAGRAEQAEILFGFLSRAIAAERRKLA